MTTRRVHHELSLPAPPEFQMMDPLDQQEFDRWLRGLYQALQGRHREIADAVNDAPRYTLLWSDAAPPNPGPGYAALAGGVTSVRGYLAPREAKVIAWWGHWTGAIAAGTTVRLEVNGVVQLTYTASLGDTRFVGQPLDPPISLAAGDQVAISSAGNSGGITDLVVNVEMAWSEKS